MKREKMESKISQQLSIEGSFWYNCAITVQNTIQVQKVIEIASCIKRYCGFFFVNLENEKKKKLNFRHAIQLRKNSFLYKL